MKYFKIFLTLGILLILSSISWADIPKLMNLQGTLTDAGGSPIRNSTVSVQFKIYDTTAAGTALWSETQASVGTDNQGAFNVLLGSVIPIPDAVFGDTGRWLGIKVGSDAEMTPRVRLASIGYSYRVNSIDEATGGDIYGNVFLHSFLRAGDLAGNDGLIQVTDGANITGLLDGEDDLGGGGAKIALDNGANITTITLDADVTGDAAYLSMSDGSNTTVTIEAEGATDGGAQILLDNSANVSTILLDADINNGAFVSMSDGVNPTITLDAKVSGSDAGAAITLKNSLNDTTMVLDADQGNAAFFAMKDATGKEIVHLDAAGADGGAQFSLRDDGGQTTISLDAESGVDGGANVSFRKGDGVETIRLDANWAGTGFGRIVTSELQINGGADLSEQFNVKAKDGKLEPGMIVSIDVENPGELVVCKQAYDHRVAGILSGAGDIRPGMLMGQSGSEADGSRPVALTGRVYCWADAANGAIQPGDLLTTSDTPGYAMKVTDYHKAQGAIIGKAMTSLKEGKGLVLVLVNLQ